MPVIKDPQVLLNPFKPNDIETVVGWDDDRSPGFFRFLSPLKISRDQLAQMLLGQNNQYWLATSEKTQKPVGLFGVKKIWESDSLYRLDWVQAPGAFDQPLIQKCVWLAAQHTFQQLKARKVLFYLFATDQAASAIVLGCNAKKEGVLKEHFLENGKLSDVAAWGMFPEDLI